jgi:hypothetical protein
MARSKSGTHVLKDLAKNPKVRSSVVLAAAGVAGAVAGSRRKSNPNNAVPDAVAEPAAPEAPVVQGYCVKERKKVQIQDPVQVMMKNGKPAVQGVCPDCGTKIFKIGKLA